MEVRPLLLKMSGDRGDGRRCRYSVMTSTSGNEARDILRQRLSKAIQHSIGTVELGKFVRYIESSLYRTPLFDEFSKKQPKCSLYRGIVNN